MSGDRSYTLPLSAVYVQASRSYLTARQHAAAAESRTHTRANAIFTTWELTYTSRVSGHVSTIMSIVHGDNNCTKGVNTKIAPAQTHAQINTHHIIQVVTLQQQVHDAGETWSHLAAVH